MFKEKVTNIAFSNKIITLEFDFSKEVKVTELADLLKTTLKDEKLNQVSELYVFYNHGTLQLATIERSADMASNEFQTNVVSVWTLMSAIRHLFPLNLFPTQFHVNISSLLADKPQESFSLYNTSKFCFRGKFTFFSIYYLKCLKKKLILPCFNIIFLFIKTLKYLNLI